MYVQVRRKRRAPEWSGFGVSPPLWEVEPTEARREALINLGVKTGRYAPEFAADIARRHDIPTTAPQYSAMLPLPMQAERARMEYMRQHPEIGAAPQFQTTTTEEFQVAPDFKRRITRSPLPRERMMRAPSMLEIMSPEQQQQYIGKQITPTPEREPRAPSMLELMSPEQQQQAIEKQIAPTPERELRAPTLLETMSPEQQQQYIEKQVAPAATFTQSSVQRGLGALVTGAPSSVLGVPMEALVGREDHEAYATNIFGPDWRTTVPQAVEIIDAKFAPEKTGGSPYPEYPDAFEENGVWKVMRNGKKYRIED